jgi:DNA-binding transcriptional ArsR family regulator
MLDVAVIDDPAAATAALDSIKARLLAELSEPASAAALATRVGLTRQKVNYHLRALEAHQLVEPAGERYWGGLTERLMVATASSYVVSPAALGSIGADPARNNDRLSASYLIALGARMVREVGDLWRGARRRDRRLATLSVDAVIRFKSPADRAAFTTDLATAIAALAARYHDEGAPHGRPHRLVVTSYPAPDQTRSERKRHADQERREG